MKQVGIGPTEICINRDLIGMQHSTRAFIGEGNWISGHASTVCIQAHLNIAARGRQNFH